MKTTVFKITAVAAFVLATSAFAQSATQYANVPFKVNVDATVTAVQGDSTVAIEVAANVQKNLRLPLQVNTPTSVQNTGRTRGQLNAPIITASRGNITLRLPPQSYQNAEVALYSINGKRILRGKADAKDAVSSVSRRNVAAGVYMLSVKGTNGNTFTTRLTHSGGGMNINVAFGGESASPARQLGKQAADGDWDWKWKITVSAVPTEGEEYYDSVYTIDLQSLLRLYDVLPTQNITLKKVPPPPPLPPVIMAFTDERDGKTYKKVTIGEQTWMAENLNYREDEDGNVLGVCYDNLANNCAKYGRLYDWSTAMGDYASSSANPSGVQGVCPVGWHLPSDTEWTTLVNYVETADGCTNCAGTKLKSSTGWNRSGWGTDEYGFSALPGGYGYSVGSFSYAGGLGRWWSTTEDDADSTLIRDMGDDRERVLSYNHVKTDWLSVRCVQDAGTQPSITYTITFNQNYTGAPTATTVKIVTGDKFASLLTPTRNGYIFDGWFTAATGGTQVTTSTTFSADATIYARWGDNTFTDSRDQKVYKRVQIGTQVWMAQNLNYDVPDNTTDVCHNNSPDSCAKYGRLYNWATAMGGAASSSLSPSGVRGACPAGWHLPSDAEWTTLTDFVGGASTAGTKLKSATGWNSYSGVPVGTDQYGFSALPGGLSYSVGSFDAAGNYGYWWSSTEFDAYYAWYRDMDDNYENVGRDNYDKYFLFSVRCVQD